MSNAFKLMDNIGHFNIIVIENVLGKIQQVKAKSDYWIQKVSNVIHA